jgi:hypothetical protein
MMLRFLIATLWRASVSTHPFYARIDLGEYHRAAEQLALQDKEERGVFDVVLARWPAAAAIGVASHPVLDPYRHKFDGVNAYRLYLGETVAEIKVDRRPFPPGLVELGLRAAPPVRAVVRSFTNSKDLAAMVRTAKGALKPRQRRP